MGNRIYIAIDLKSFYASVECIERNLDPLETNLVVADASRTEKTICLAVSPALKSFGIPGRPRLFEVVTKVRQINSQRKTKAGGRFSGSSFDITELKGNSKLMLEYIVAPPRMAYYIDYSARIYDIYLKYIAPEDIHVYSIDEVFIDATDYLELYNLSAKELAAKMILDVYKSTGVSAAAGVGSNLYLAKIAMDIQAKRTSPDKDGLRIAELDVMSYRKLMWNHKPITDFWRVGKGYARRLESKGLFTMGDIARCSLGKETEYYNEDLLYKMFGINAELLIDHAWGIESCTMADIKAYRPAAKSVGAGQVLQSPYTFEKARLVTREMADALTLDLFSKRLVTDQIVLTVGYDIISKQENIPKNEHSEFLSRCTEENKKVSIRYGCIYDIINLLEGEKSISYTGEISTDSYGRQVPKSAHGTTNFKSKTSSNKIILDGVTKLFDKIVDKNLFIRRINISANRVEDEKDYKEVERFEQLDLFTANTNEGIKRKEEELLKEQKMQSTMLEIKMKYGKNAILKGMNLDDGATAAERNRLIGGHKA